MNKIEDRNLKIVFLDRATAGAIELTERFSKYGNYIEYDYTNPEELENRIKDADVLILNRVRMGKEEFLKAPKLKLIMITATGYNHIDIKEANEKGIIVSNVSNYSTNSVAQLTFTLLLNELTKVSDFSRSVKENGWEEVSNSYNQDYPIKDVEGKVIGIIGYGNIGRKVAEIAEVMGMEVMVSKIPGREYSGIESRNRYNLEEVLKKADIVSIHAPLTDLTRNIINLERIKKMKKDAILLNLGRGPLINEEDLYIALKNKLIKSAAIDVMSKEPPEIDAPLFTLDNLTITPHIAWKSWKSMGRLMDVTENNLKLFLEGKLTGLKE